MIEPRPSAECGEHGPMQRLRTERGERWRCPAPGCTNEARWSRWLDAWIVSDRDTRIAHGAAHRALDPLWKSGAHSRQAVYKRLARKLGLDMRQCHIAHLSQLECWAATELADEIRREDEDRC